MLSGCPIADTTPTPSRATAGTAPEDEASSPTSCRWDGGTQVCAASCPSYRLKTAPHCCVIPTKVERYSDYDECWVIDHDKII
ncbi:hypothetical protein GWI33_004334 [Rhynchophorus ferrugineus]|uniref:Uncharacterized protein n=1 Tax=Rhynchophorus ferrugineus TaxID=354439 RepID=A0A834MMZ7_RHYFE|nr:hypothetical protein GWI33_004334 [Rhynchophorus ferrugineus]